MTIGTTSSTTLAPTAKHPSTAATTTSTDGAGRIIPVGTAAEAAADERGHADAEAGVP